jgi:hypothetical protein
MHIFRHIFLSNYWWQRSDIWSQASYRYLISWEAFFNPSDSYFLFADLVVFFTLNIWTKNVHICSMCIKTNQVDKQEVGIWRVQKRYPQYGIPIWRLWPNIRFLPSTVTEKSVTKNILDGREDGQTDRGKTVYPPPPSGSGDIKKSVANVSICELGLLGVALTRVDAFFGGFGLTGWLTLLSLAPELKPKAESFVIFDDEFGISNCRFPIIMHTLRAKSLEKKWAHFFSTIIFIRN